MIINSITKKDGEVLSVGDVTNKGKIKFFRDYMGDCWVAVEEQPQQFKVDDVSKKGVGDGFVWTDELVSEFCFDNGTSYRGPDNDIKTHIEIGIEKFKKSKQSQPTKEDSKREWEILEFKTPSGIVWKLEDGDIYVCGGNRFSWLKNPTIEKQIISVCRLSDGEVFSVGDEIGWGCDVNYTTKINGFIIEGNRLKIQYTSNLKHPVDFMDAIRLHKKSKPKENKERIEVTQFYAAGFSDHGNWYKFHIATTPGKPWPTISEEKFLPVKKAIEAVLNDEPIKQ